VLPGACNDRAVGEKLFWEEKKTNERTFSELYRSMEEDLLSSEAWRAPAPDPEGGLSTPAAGPDTYIGPTSSMRSLATLSAEHVGLQSHHEQVLCRGLLCVCDELHSCCEHAASALSASAGADVVPDATVRAFTDRNDQ